MDGSTDGGISQHNHEHEDEEQSHNAIYESVRLDKCTKDHAEVHEGKNSIGQLGQVVPDKCYICLSDAIVNRANANSCDHVFCFTCLYEWLKHKEVCPVCKRKVEVLFYNYRLESGRLCNDILRVEYVRSHAERERIRVARDRRTGGERVILRSKILSLRSAIDYVDSTSLLNGATEFRSGLIDRMNAYQMLLDNWSRPRSEVMADPIFRRLVYDCCLVRREIQQSTNNLREQERSASSLEPLFFVQHEAEQLPRVVEFLKRELQAAGTGYCNEEVVAEVIYGYMKQYPMLSKEFTSSLLDLRAFKRRYARFLIKLLYEFVNSLQTLAEFDAHSEYHVPGERGIINRRRNVNRINSGALTAQRAFAEGSGRLRSSRDVFPQSSSLNSYPSTIDISDDELLDHTEIFVSSESEEANDVDIVMQYSSYQFARSNGNLSRAANSINGLIGPSNSSSRSREVDDEVLIISPNCTPRHGLSISDPLSRIARKRRFDSSAHRTYSDDDSDVEFLFENKPGTSKTLRKR